MWARRGAGRADPTDDLALIDVRAGVDAFPERGEVQIIRFDAPRVLQVHEIAARSAVSGGHDGAARHRDDGRSDRRRVVDAEMRARHIIIGCMRCIEKPDVTRGSNFKGERSMKRFSDRPLSS